MNKVKMNIDYKHQYTELDENPLSSINSFNVNTVLQLIENFINKTFKKGNVTYQYWNNKKGKMEGKQHLTSVSIKRRNLERGNIVKPNYIGGEYDMRWLFELSIFGDYDSWKRGFFVEDFKMLATYHKGYICYSLNDLLIAVIDECKRFDKDIFNEVQLECLKGLFKRHNVISLEDFNSRLSKCDTELSKYEREYIKSRDEKTEKINRFWKEVTKGGDFVNQCFKTLNMQNKLIKTLKSNKEIRNFYQLPLRGGEKVTMDGKSLYMVIQNLDDYGKPIQHRVKYPKTNIREKECGNCSRGN